MFSSLFLAVVEAHEAAAHAVEPSIAERFGLEPKYVAIQALSFLILFVVLYFKGIKPTIAAMTDRQATIDSGIKYAEAMKAKLEAIQAESAAAHKKAQLEATKIIEEARKVAKEFSERETAAATERANGLVTKAQQAIDLEHKKMLEQARGEIARLVVTTTQRVLAKELSDADRARYNEAATRELSVL